MNAIHKPYRHVVLFKFKPTTTAETVVSIENAFRTFAASLPFVAGFEWGHNSSPEKLDKGFTHCFIVTFKNEADRDAYLPHPEHKRFVHDYLDTNLDDVCVVDFYAGA
ncbi:Dabb family protein [Treponema sp.]